MSERIVRAGEVVVQALSSTSSLLIVEVLGAGSSGEGASFGFSCRGCLLLDLTCTKSVRELGLVAVLEHLDRHVAADHAGAKDAIAKLEMCAPCRGSGMRSFSEKCASCSATGKNEQGRKRAKDREVRRGVVVG